MNENLKEILDDIRFVVEEPSILEEVNEDGEIYMQEYDNFAYLPYEQAKILYDYITNLEEKYERMKENAEILSNGYDELLKQKEKAIEYMNNTFNIESMKEFYQHLDNIEHILEGEDKE